LKRPVEELREHGDDVDLHGPTTWPLLYLADELDPGSLQTLSHRPIVIVEIVMFLEVGNRTI